MRILISARYTIKQQPIGGVQSWIEAIAAVLRKSDCEVVTWGKGEPTHIGQFDLGILSNWCDTGHLAMLCKRTVSVSHGIIKPEEPGPADRQVFTSEEVAGHWNRDGAEIIRQPIDLDFWSPAQARREYLTRHSYRLGLEFVPMLASKLNLKFRHIRTCTYREVREQLRRSAVVLATGRAALEAMACGAPVVLCDDRRPYMQPMMNTGSMTDWMLTNYSARGGFTPTPDKVEREIKEAMERVPVMYGWVTRHHDARLIADELIG